MTSFRSRCARTFSLLLTSALLVVSGGKHLLICIEVDGRIHLESGAELCCDSDAPPVAASALISVQARAGDDCGSCRDVLAGSAPARPNDSGPALPPAFHLCAGPNELGDRTGLVCDLPATDPPSLTLASIQTIVIRC